VDAPSHAEHLDVASIGCVQSFQNLNRRRLAGAIWTEQPKTLPGAHLEIEPVYSHDGVVAFS
jgi:hypothetical protein